MGATDFTNTGSSAALITQAANANSQGVKTLVLSGSVTVTKGMGVSGTGVATGTRVATGGTGASVVIDTATSGVVAATTVITFHPITLTLGTADVNVRAGQVVTGVGIPTGALVASCTPAAAPTGSPAAAATAVTLSLPITAQLATTPLTFSKGSVSVTRTQTAVDNTPAKPLYDNGEVTIEYDIAFHGDDLRGNVPQLVLATNALTNSSQQLHHVSIGMSTTTEGNEPDGSFYLTYECESRLTEKGFSATGTTGSTTVVLGKPATVGQTLRLKKAGDATALWSYFKVTAEVATGAGPSYTITVDHAVTALMGGTTTYTADVGVFFSDANDKYGVSAGCYAADPATTLRMDHDISADGLREKLENLAQIPSGGGVVVSRRPIPPGNQRHFNYDYVASTAGQDFIGEVIGYDYNVTFLRNNGDIHPLACVMTHPTNPYIASNPAANLLAPPKGKQCSTTEWTEADNVDGSFIGGTFTLGLSYPHWQQEHDGTGVEADYTTAAVRFDATADEVQAAMDAVVDTHGAKVFGSVGVTRTAYTPSAETKWSGQYLWVVTFLSRPGNVPTLLPDPSQLFVNANDSWVGKGPSGRAQAYGGVEFGKPGSTG